MANPETQGVKEIGRIRMETDLCFGEVERLRQLLAFRTHHVVILLEGVFQFQQLARTERRAHPFRFAERRQQETGQLGTCAPRKQPSVNLDRPFFLTKKSEWQRKKGRKSMGGAPRSTN